MIINYMAYANMINGQGKRWRVNIGRYEDEVAAQIAADRYEEKYKTGAPIVENVGTHRFYTFTRAEWDEQQYTGRSIKDSNTRTWMTNEGTGCVLLFEHDHFEII